MRRTGLLLCAVPVLLIGLTAVPAAATTPTTLYVARNLACVDTGPGTLAQPFCDIQAAANVVQPGQTVVVGPNASHETYDGDVHVTHSGTPDQPITFETGLPWQGFDPAVTVEPLAGDARDTNGFLLDGVHDVTITGFDFAHDTSTGVTVSNSSDIRIDHDRMDSADTADGVDVTGTSHDVTISRDDLEDGVDAIDIGPGVARVDVARNFISAGVSTQVVVDDATGTTIVNNTGVQAFCHQQANLVAVSNGASATTIENNLLGLSCTVAPSPAVLVTADSAATTTLDYNVVVDTQNLPYEWAGTTYGTAADLATHTGQGTHDLNVNPQVDGSWIPRENSPAVDSADANAPGFLAKDFNGFAPEDDPLVANTGTGPGDVDRGAFERTDPMTLNGDLSAFQAPSGGTVTETLSSIQGWAPITGYLVDFGDGTPAVPTTGLTVQHVYTTTGFHSVTATVTDSLGNVSAPTVVGSITVVPPAPLVPRVTTHQIAGGFEAVADATATSDAWNLVSATCDLGDGTGPHSMYPAMSCVHTYAHGGVYRITVSATDAGGNTATTSTLLAVPANGFSSVPTRLFNNGAGCAVCRSASDVTQGIPAATSNVAAPAVTNAAVLPVHRVGATRGVVAPRNGCVARAPCPATIV